MLPMYEESSSDEEPRQQAMSSLMPSMAMAHAPPPPPPPHISMHHQYASLPALLEIPQAAQAPVAPGSRKKKSRVAVTWTAQLDTFLRDAIETLGENWYEVSLNIQNRFMNQGSESIQSSRLPSPDECSKRWKIVNPESRNFPPWTEEEKIRLARIVDEAQSDTEGFSKCITMSKSGERVRTISWVNIAGKLKRSVEDVSHMWAQIRVARFKRGAFSEEEDRKILQRVQEWNTTPAELRPRAGLWVSLEKELGREDKRISERYRNILFKRISQQQHQHQHQQHSQQQQSSSSHSQTQAHQHLQQQHQLQQQLHQQHLHALAASKQSMAYPMGSMVAAPVVSQSGLPPHYLQHHAQQQQHQQHLHHLSSSAPTSSDAPVQHGANNAMNSAMAHSSAHHMMHAIPRYDIYSVLPPNSFLMGCDDQSPMHNLGIDYGTQPHHHHSLHHSSSQLAQPSHSPLEILDVDDGDRARKRSFDDLNSNSPQLLDHPIPTSSHVLLAGYPCLHEHEVEEIHRKKSRAVHPESVRWNDAMDSQLLEGAARFGLDWSKIADFVNEVPRDGIGRGVVDPNKCRGRWYRVHRKKEGGVDEDHLPDFVLHDIPSDHESKPDDLGSIDLGSGSL